MLDGLSPSSGLDLFGAYILKTARRMAFATRELGKRTWVFLDRGSVAYKTAIQHHFKARDAPIGCTQPRSRAANAALIGANLIEKPAWRADRLNQIKTAPGAGSIQIAAHLVGK